jgi:1A family penicillin-binding protein
MVRAHGLTRRLALVVVTLTLTCGAWSVWWVSRYALAVHRLAGSLGDTVFYSADGKPWFRLDEQHHDVPLAEVAPDLQHAVIAVEDRRFYYHPGLDMVGIARAVWHDVRDGGAFEGGSTLTQQLARTLFLSNVRSYSRKAKEAVLALAIEKELTKDQILELYLNRVYLSAGVYGVESMSEHLYRKPASALTLAESALIAGLIRAPSALSPWSHYDEAIERSHVVIALMREQGFITAAQEDAARHEPPRIRSYRLPTDARAAWVKDYLRQQFRDHFGGDRPTDWQVHTTVRQEIQEAAEQAVAAGLRRLNRSGLEAAFVAMDPVTGDLLAMVGGGDYAKSTFNRATRSRRQPGSAFKPFVYAASLGHGLSPVSVLSSLGSVAAPEDPEWSQRNADLQQPNGLTLRAALLESNNAAAVQLQQRVGTRQVLRLAGEAGLSDLPDVPSLALGAGLVTPLDLVAAYSIFPGGGRLARPRSIVSVVDADGTEVFQQRPDGVAVIDEAVAFQMVSMLEDVIDRGTASGARSAGLKGPLGGKTGTTDDYHDAWFVGFSSSVVAGVWVGFDQPAPIGREAYAARIALPIWVDFMKSTARWLPAKEFVAPDGVRPVVLCSVSYLRPVNGCPTYTEYFKPGDSVPSDLCPVHKGAFGQQSQRAIGGIFRSLGRRIAGLFRRGG